jgi:hypothetical protein
MDPREIFSSNLGVWIVSITYDENSDSLQEVFWIREAAIAYIEREAKAREDDYFRYVQVPTYDENYILWQREIKGVAATGEEYWEEDYIGSLFARKYIPK